MAQVITCRVIYPYSLSENHELHVCNVFSCGLDILGADMCMSSSVLVFWHWHSIWYISPSIIENNLFLSPSVLGLSLLLCSAVFILISTSILGLVLGHGYSCSLGSCIWFKFTTIYVMQNFISKYFLFLPQKTLVSKFMRFSLPSIWESGILP